jgi:diguanylate cyclase (GGDEF)-like protein/PAS domain S-box-containing protein
MRDGVYFTNKDRIITLWNKAAEDITGYLKEDMLGKDCQETHLRHIDGEGHLICTAGCPLHHTLADGQQRKHNVFLKHKEGHRIPISVNVFPIKEEDKIVGVIEIFTPDSPNVYENDLIEQLSNSAMNDQLTGIPNRRKVENFLDFRFKEMKLFQNKFCVIFLDLDNFRVFNNTYGHDAGDAVLISVSKSIMHMIRSADLFGRWGGEEFIGIFVIKKDDDAVLLAEKIRALIEGTEITHEDMTLSVTASIGVTVADNDDTIETVVKRADEMMYQSKQNGKNRVSSDVNSHGTGLKFIF